MSEERGYCVGCHHVWYRHWGPGGGCEVCRCGGFVHSSQQPRIMPESELAAMEAVCDHDRSFARSSTREIICCWCGELLGRT